MACTAGALSDSSIISMPLLVHLAQPPVLDVQHAALDLLPDAVGKIAVRILERLRNREMLFECDLALHGPSSGGSSAGLAPAD